MSLTLAQKSAGRAFLAARQQALSEMGEAAPCSSFTREYRHSCPKVNGASAAIRCREHYETSPGYLHSSGEEVPEGLFALIWVEGKCACGLRVRSWGRLVIAADRPRLRQCRTKGYDYDP